MRLTTFEIQAIKKTVHHLDSQAKIYLFGSRVDDHLQGGDIDLLIFSQRLGFHDRRRIRLELYPKIGEQKIDIVIAQDRKDPFVRIAYEQGVLL